MSKPRAHAELIKAWADGAEIEWFNPRCKQWDHIPCPYWGEEDRYRIKPHTVRYRLALMKNEARLNSIYAEGAIRVLSANNEAHADILQASKHFVRWLTDWETFTLEDQQ